MPGDSSQVSLLSTCLGNRRVILRQSDILRMFGHLDVLCTPLIPALERQMQVDFCELEAPMVYLASDRPGRTI